MTRITAMGLTALLLEFVFGSTVSLVNASEYTPERFLTECRAGFTKLAERARQCHGQYKMIDGGYALGLQYLRDVEFAVSDNQLLLKTYFSGERRRGKPDKVHDQRAVRGANSEYSFRIILRNQTGEYRLDTYELASDVKSDLLGGKIRNRIRFWMSPVEATHCMGSFPLVPLLDHPSFRLVKLSDQTRDGIPVIRAEFDARPGTPQTDPRVSWTRGKVFGWFEVAPTQGWTVRAFEYTYFAAGAKPETPLAKARAIGEVGYVPGPDGLPVVSHYKQATAWLDKPPDPYIEMNDIQITFGPTSAEQFRLTHYNLPEPIGVAPPPKTGIPTYWWVLLAASVFASAALMFHWLARRARRRTIPQPAPSPGV